MRFLTVSNRIDLRGDTIELVEKLGVRQQGECRHYGIGLNGLFLSLLSRDGQPCIGYLLILNFLSNQSSR